MNGDETMFGVNFADGRIKGYPTGPMPGQSEDKGYFVYYVRGNPGYGINKFVDNGDGTISDDATGLMWQQGDSESALNWQEALAWVQQKNSENYLGHYDWRLPNVKELHSIVDYTRSPATTNSPAIDPVFNCSTVSDEGGVDNYPFYWSGTTHANMQNGGNASYVAFGEGLGWMEMPPMSGNYNLMDVHGAGCQRSDPKSGDPADYPYGHGPQGDVIRIYNHVRLVRDDDMATGLGEKQKSIPQLFELEQNYPNPFNPETVIPFTLAQKRHVILSVYNVAGQLVRILVNDRLSAGTHSVRWYVHDMANGVYYCTLKYGPAIQTRSMTYLK